MASRAEKLARLVSLMKLQLRLSEWQLAQLRQQEQALQDEEAWLIGALNALRPPAGSSSASIARRLTTTSVGARAVQAEASRQLDQVRTENRRVKQVEQVARAAAADRRREAEKRSLEEIAGRPVRRHDWLAATKGAGSRQ
ncbi:hypothetical protein CI1B_12180 [Bradyrhizobium ivorense]|uniref:Flagellar FliJ protein n=1 Tax=Bradyrhizobium ivorense TaxID=2511166 RepID=A0A508SVR4_9BRAD|nr:MULTISPECIES: hypothetical protein [Bradyrhizobium]QOZ28775.1 hypothetical protein XH93_38395 [Bradyrhizobium sp. CCBAU 51753]VIO66106.1 hypothetical protein CI1B_12180 [Bradyrhizobium ivorense]